MLCIHLCMHVFVCIGTYIDSIAAGSETKRRAHATRRSITLQCLPRLSTSAPSAAERRRHRSKTQNATVAEKRAIAVKPSNAEPFNNATDRTLRFFSSAFGVSERKKSAAIFVNLPSIDNRYDLKIADIASLVTADEHRYQNTILQHAR